jgi:hypothetical protein
LHYFIKAASAVVNSISRQRLEQQEIPDTSSNRGVTNLLILTGMRKGKGWRLPANPKTFLVFAITKNFKIFKN